MENKKCLKPPTSRDKFMNRNINRAVTLGVSFGRLMPGFKINDLSIGS
jgi:hypothetical protein